MNNSTKFDGFLICSGNSKKQINQFKRMFARDNLPDIKKSDRYLQMRKLLPNGALYVLDVYYQKDLVGHFGVKIVETQKMSNETFCEMNKQAEEMFREESNYGIKDFPGLDRINNALYGGYGSYEAYPTITSKAAALWHKIASNQFFHNGNKRTAMLSAIYFLAGNFYTFDIVDANLLYDISLHIANNEMSVKKLEAFIGSHVSLSYGNMADALKDGEFSYSQSLIYKNTQ